MKEKIIIQECIHQLLLFPVIKSVSILEKEIYLNNRNIDTNIEIVTASTHKKFSVTVKNTIKRPLPDHLAMQIDKDQEYLLMAQYINPSIAKDLKIKNIQFVDMHGNAYLYLENQIYIDVQGKKGPKIQNKREPLLFHPKGLELLFNFLVNSGLMNKPIREISSITGISYGQTQIILKELKTRNLIYKNKNSLFQFTNKKEMLEKWIMNYGDRLRPKLVLGTFRISATNMDEIIQKLSDINQSGEILISGTLGADILVPYYKGNSIELFIQQKMYNSVKEHLNLIPADNPNITLLNQFSPLVAFKEEQKFTTHPLLIYAELLFKKESRATETAKIIYDKYIEKILNDN